MGEIRCLVLGALFTREELLARGVTPDGAEELLAFAKRLAVKATMRAHGLRPIDQDRFGRGEGNCLAACVATLTGRALAEVTDGIGHGSGDDETEHWYDRLTRALASWGWSVSYDTAEVPLAYAIANGLSERGLQHSCVAFSGEIVHDPHPSRAGLVEITSWLTLRRASTPTERPSDAG